MGWDHDFWLPGPVGPWLRGFLRRLRLDWPGIAVGAPDRALARPGRIPDVVPTFVQVGRDESMLAWRDRRGLVVRDADGGGPFDVAWSPRVDGSIHVGVVTPEDGRAAFTRFVLARWYQVIAVACRAGGEVLPGTGGRTRRWLVPGMDPAWARQTAVVVAEVLGLASVHGDPGSGNLTFVDGDGRALALHVDDAPAGAARLAIDCPHDDAGRARAAFGLAEALIGAWFTVSYRPTDTASRLVERGRPPGRARLDGGLVVFDGPGGPVPVPAHTRRR